jgi:CheY-like chemotaxis protein
MKRILVIDDEPEIRELIKAKLESGGYVVELATDGVEGVKLFYKNPADLIITDIIMPGKEGIEVIQELLSDYSAVKIIAISGGGQHTSKQFCLNLAEKLGAVRTFNKPFKLADLLTAVQEELGD